MIGGEGVEIEADETCVSKRKYNRGRMVRHQQWLAGGVERNSEGRRCFVEMVPNRKRLYSRTCVPSKCMRSKKIYASHQSVCVPKKIYASHQSVCVLPKKSFI